jgi:Uma2 family endonuclease
VNGATESVTLSSVDPSLATRRFTVAEVLRMVEVGILHEDEPYELIGGRLVEVSPRGPTHARLVGKLAERLRAVYRSAPLVVREEKPMVASEHSLPEPDVAVARGDFDSFAEAHPSGTDLVLVVETSVTSQATDHQKAAEYARAGVPVFWLIDVPARRVEVHQDPRPDGRYRLVRVLAGDDELDVPETDEHWPAASLFT